MREENPRRRLACLLERDKERINEGTRAALLGDLAHVVDEYFDREGELVLHLEERGGKTQATLSFRVNRVKNLTVLK